jgi:hypothetical protein
VGLVRASGLVAEWHEHFEGDGDTLTAFCRIVRVGGSESVESFGVDDAKRAKLWDKQTYQQYPRRMLMWRARTFVMRDLFADVLKGLTTVEEARDLPPREVVAEPASSDVDGMSPVLDQQLQREVQTVQSAGLPPS